MCGISGFNWEDKDLINKMNNSLKHRGPDGEGSYTDNLVSLGHRRLAIIDLTEKGKQPMEYERKGRKVVIIYNGELYNFQEIREKLEKKGYNFKSDTDTEVILASYLEYGFNCVQKFNGMWAFCIYDITKKILFFSRDRIGKKPFYYYFDGDKFIFSSEIKGILNCKIEKEINKKGLEVYLSLGFIPAPLSIFKNIYKLERTQNLVFNLKTKKIRKFYYWGLPYFKPNFSKNILIKEGRDLLDDSTKLRKIADVEVGTFLSGGLDSSAISATMKKFKEKLHTFSIGFEDKKLDESKYAYLMSDYLGTEHHHYYFTEKDFDKLIGDISFIYDEPFGDMSSFPTMKVSELAKKYVTVVLSGDGGDEVFGGYNIHSAAAKIEFFRKIPEPIRRFLYNSFNRLYFNYKSSLFLIGKEGFKISLMKNKDFYLNLFEKEKYLSKEAINWYSINFSKILKKYKSLTESVIKFDLLNNTLSDNFLVKVDRASMANALEVRCPFLDYRFLEFSNRIPTRYKVDIFKTKKIFREIIKDRVPRKIINRGKRGFEPPIVKWLYSDYKGFLEENLDNLKKRKILSEEQKNYLDKLMNKKQTIKLEKTGEQLYNYLILELWAKKWL